METSGIMIREPVPLTKSSAIGSKKSSEDRDYQRSLSCHHVVLDSIRYTGIHTTFFKTSMAVIFSTSLGRWPVPDLVKFGIEHCLYHKKHVFWHMIRFGKSVGSMKPSLSLLSVRSVHIPMGEGWTTKNYIEIRGHRTLRQAVTGMIHPAPDKYRPYLFVITHFPQQA